MPAFCQALFRALVHRNHSSIRAGCQSRAGGELSIQGRRRTFNSGQAASCQFRAGGDLPVQGYEMEARASERKRGRKRKTLTEKRERREGEN